MSSLDCPVCETSGTPLLEGVTDYHVAQDKAFDVQYCSHCFNGFSLPKMSERDLKPFYTEQYEAYQPRTGFLGWIQRTKYRMDIKLISEVAPPKSNLYEIGAGRGEFLREAKEKGFKVAGLEPSPIGRQFAKEHFQIELQDMSASQLNLAEPVDVVVARHVVEHVNEPHELLKHILDRCLRPEGTLFLKIPNFASWERKLFGKYWAGWDLPRHRFHFSPQGIEHLLLSIGYKDIQVRDEIVPSAIVWSIGHVARHCNQPLLKTLFKLVNALPKPALVLAAQMLAVIMAPFKAGRMIVIARKA